MHSQETKLQFIELRAQEKTLEEISTTLNVCQRTLVDWNREFADDIADLREVARESLRRKLFGTTHDWMKHELDHYKRLDEELARRQFKYSPTESVFRMRAESRKTIEKFLFAESPWTSRDATRSPHPSRQPQTVGSRRRSRPHLSLVETPRRRRPHQTPMNQSSSIPVNRQGPSWQNAA